jgi:hypothetical protein
MITKEEKNRFANWCEINNRRINSQERESCESCFAFVECGLIECGLYEKELTTKEKYESFKNGIASECILGADGVVPIATVNNLCFLADKAIKEAEEKNGIG